jgi:hypothetical protein
MLSLIHKFLVVRTSFIVRDNSSVRNTFQPLMQKAVTLRAREKNLNAAHISSLLRSKCFTATTWTGRSARPTIESSLAM